MRTKQSKNKLIKRKQPRTLDKYNAIRSELDTGDIVLFSGTGFISRMIQIVTRSEFSHVGMVVRVEEWDMLLLFESTTLSKIKHVETGKRTQGVQLVSLSERIKSYKADKVMFRQLKGVVRSQEMRDTFRKFRQEVKGRPYEKSKWELFCSAYDWIGGKNKKNLLSLFCSELVAEMFQRWGLLISDENSLTYTASNEITPANFAKWKDLWRGYLGEYIRV